MKYNRIEMHILSGIYVWTQNVEMTVELRRFFSGKLGLVRSTTCRIVMKLNGVLDYHIRMCILSGIYVRAKIVEVMAV